MKLEIINTTIAGAEAAFNAFMAKKAIKDKLELGLLNIRYLNTISTGATNVSIFIYYTIN